MAFTNLLTNTIDIYRAQQGTGNTTSYGDEPYNPGVACLIQPIIGEYTSKVDMNFGRQYHCLLPVDTDINIADRCVDADTGKTYQVSGSLYRPYGNATPHITMILTEEATEGPDD